MPRERRRRSSWASRRGELDIMDLADAQSNSLPRATSKPAFMPTSTCDSRKAGVAIDARSGRDQFDHRCGRRGYGPRAGRRRRGPGRDHAHAQRESSDPGSREHVRADHQIRDANSRTGDRHGNRPQSVQSRANRKTRSVFYRFSRKYRRSERRRQAAYRSAAAVHFHAA